MKHLETQQWQTNSCQQKSSNHHKTHHSDEEPPLHPDPPIKIPEKNLPRQGRSDIGASLHSNPIHKEGPTTENLKVLETLLSNRFTPQVLETRGEGEVGWATELDGASVPPTERADHRKKPLPEEKGPGQSENEHVNLPQSISVFFHLPP